MKNLHATRWFGSLLITFMALFILSPKEVKAENNNGVSFQVFYDELMPYGDWIKDARYGYVWLPAVQENFHPYGSDGHWVMTDYGNTWVSDYDWGWAPFHYGRWFYTTNYQSWAWIPDYNWGPAWVDWRTGGGYYGWAPMGPGFSINFRVNIPASYWLFVPQRRFAYANVYNYYVPRARRVSIYNNTTIINNTIVYNDNRYYAGPSRSDVERSTRTSYPVRSISSARTPGRTAVSRESVNVYRPELKSSRDRSVSDRPSRVINSTEARTTRTSASAANTSAQPRSAIPRTATRTNSTNRSSVTPKRATTSPEMTVKPYAESTRTAPNQGRRVNLANSTRTPAPNVTSTPSRQSSATPTRSTPREASPAQNTRIQPATSPRSNVRQGSTVAPATRATQPAQTRTTSTPARVGSNSRTQPSRPAVRSSPAPARQTQAAPRRSTPQVRSSAGSRTAPASTSRASTSGSRNSSRGNN